MISRNDPCWCGSDKKWKKCHWPNEGPPPSGADLRDHYKRQYNITLKTKEQIEKIRKACKLTAKILQETASLAKAGVTTKALDDFVRKRCKETNSIPASLGVGDPPFPAALCTSLNEVICHGIPDDVPLKDGDIVNIDIALIHDGYVGDSSVMVMIGDVSEEKARVVKTAYECLMESIKILQPGGNVSDIGDVIERIASENRCSVVDQFVGHGVGLSMHEPPQIPHHKTNINIPLVEGMIFTIEPMINIGVRDAVIDSDNGWVARTRDGKPSAQCEHTILITADGYEILTIA